MLLLRGATSTKERRFTASCFNTCSSCEEQHAFFALFFLPETFQYMLLLRGATFRRKSESTTTGRFNTCSSCEEQQLDPFRSEGYPVSIHAPLARSNKNGRERGSTREFQYMLLLRGATDRQRRDSRSGDVSIHAPLARSNRGRFRPSTRGSGFNTCSSCEEQPCLVRLHRHRKRRFNTCSSCEEQLDRTVGDMVALGVSIHAPLARSNPRSKMSQSAPSPVSIHAPLARSNAEV